MPKDLLLSEDFDEALFDKGFRNFDNFFRGSYLYVRCVHIPTGIKFCQSISDWERTLKQMEEEGL